MGEFDCGFTVGDVMTVLKKKALCVTVCNLYLRTFPLLDVQHTWQESGSAHTGRQKEVPRL